MSNKDDDKKDKTLPTGITTTSDSIDIDYASILLPPKDSWYQPTFPVTDFDFEGIRWPLKDRGICTKCKKEGEVHTRYNWGDDKKLQRTICKKCHTKTMDKLYGVDNNVDTEMILYEESKRDKDEK